MVTQVSIAAVGRHARENSSTALTPATAADEVASTNPVGGAADGGHVDAPNLRYFVMALFFIFGGITSLNDVIIPKLKELFTLNYAQAMLVQSAFSPPIW